MSNTNTKTETSFVGEATYNGRRYPITWWGTTKYGDKAKLCFADNLDKEWWVKQSDLLDVDHFPAPIDPTDYRPGFTFNTPDTTTGSLADVNEPDSAIDLDDDAPSYCAHCGQRLEQ